MKRGHEIVDHVLQAIQGCRSGTGTTIVGIDGPGGAGKSVLAASIARKDSRISVVPIDGFYVPRNKRLRGRDALPAPWKNIEVARLEEEVLQPLIAGDEASYRRYDWGSDALAERRVVPADGIVLVEGVYALLPPLKDYYHLRVWIDCPRELRLARGLARDGQDALAQWRDQWMPAEDRYASIQRPKDGADLVLGWERMESGHPALVLKRRDIDLLIRSRDLDAARAVLASVGFTIPGGLIPFDAGLPHERNVFRMSKAIGDDLLTVDLLLLPVFLAEVRNRRETYELDDVLVTVVSVEGLITMKMIAGRHQDLSDVEQLEGAP